MKESINKGNTLQIGGQAVVEGVTMRTQHVVTTAVRKRNGEILVKKEPFVSVGERFRVFRLPIFRGAAGLVEMLVVGVRTLNYSAEVAIEDEEAEGRTRNEGKSDRPTGERTRAGLAVTVTVSILLGIAVFFATPIVATTLLLDIDQQPLMFNLTTGAVRIGLLLAYLGLLSMSNDIRRLFQYHGAEHKAVFAYERGVELTASEAAKQPRFHPRCGTSFLIVVIGSAILLFAAFDAWLIGMVGRLDLATRLVTHLPLIPLVGGLSYELIRVSTRRSNSLFWRGVISPGLWLQRITTKEPDESQLEVALVALRCALGESEQLVMASIQPTSLEEESFTTRQVINA